MNKSSRQSGFAVIETLLIIIILAIVGFTGWYVWHSKQSTDKTLNNASNSDLATLPAKKASAVTTFAECKAAAGSIMQETYPEKCVTKSGKLFTDTASAQQTYLTIKEWGVKIPLTPAINDAIYADSNSDKPVASQIGLSLSSLDGTLCKAGSTAPALYFRYTANDTDPVSGQLDIQKYGTTHKVGDYYYAYMNGNGVSQANGCNSTSANQTKADAAAKAFELALTQIQAE